MLFTGSYLYVTTPLAAQPNVTDTFDGSLFLVLEEFW